jgi:hypothetical protein
MWAIRFGLSNVALRLSAICRQRRWYNGENSYKTPHWIVFASPSMCANKNEGVFVKESPKIKQVRA